MFEMYLTQDGFEPKHKVKASIQFMLLIVFFSFEVFFLKFLVQIFLLIAFLKLFVPTHNIACLLSV
jgi:hypothetical protein